MREFDPMSSPRVPKEARNRKSPTGRPGILRRIRDDLNRGHNLELYVTASLALGAGALGVFDIVDARVVGAATLAVLALLAVSGIASRHQLDEVRTARWPTSPKARSKQTDTWIRAPLR